MDHLKFPIGEYQPIKELDKTLLNKWITQIEQFPEELEQLVNKLPVEALQWKYRPEGWSIKQVIHHCTDSHMNAIIRVKLALTEEKPKILPYFEAEWAELADDTTDDISFSIQLLKGLHKKWVVLLTSLTEEQLIREFFHPEHGTSFTIFENIGNYAWHSKHHLAHVKNAILAGGKYN